MFENTVLRKIFGSNGEVGKGDSRKLHIEELQYLFPSPKVIRVIRTKRRDIRGMYHAWGFYWRNLKKETTWKSQDCMGE